MRMKNTLLNLRCMIYNNILRIISYQRTTFNVIIMTKGIDSKFALKSLSSNMTIYVITTSLYSIDNKFSS